LAPTFAAYHLADFLSSPRPGTFVAKDNFDQDKCGNEDERRPNNGVHEHVFENEHPVEARHVPNHSHNIIGTVPGGERFVGHLGELLPEAEPPGQAGPEVPRLDPLPGQGTCEKGHLRD
jgi:hypothetical protein